MRDCLYLPDGPKSASSQIAINVPDYAVAHFVPRLDIQKELNDWLLNEMQQERVILRGMGGAGKS